LDCLPERTDLHALVYHFQQKIRKGEDLRCLMGVLVANGAVMGRVSEPAVGSSEKKWKKWGRF
jgi:hypothetical protein